MSIVRDYEAEAQWPLLKWLGESISELDRLLDPPERAATAVTSTPQDERFLAEPETAGLGLLSGRE